MAQPGRVTASLSSDILKSISDGYLCIPCCGGIVCRHQTNNGKHGARTPSWEIETILFPKKHTFTRSFIIRLNVYLKDLKKNVSFLLKLSLWSIFNWEKLLGTEKRDLRWASSSRYYGTSEDLILETDVSFYWTENAKRYWRLDLKK